jgi:probable FeS assembly SUF system protein SufT
MTTTIEPRDRELNRETPAVQIPSGDPVTLAKGTSVTITQTLGGSFTVLTDQGLVRIEGAHADALGIDPGEAKAKTSTPADGPVEKPTEEALWAQLRNVYDPEIPVNIVDLGLVYSLDIKPGGDDGGYRVDMQMTLTAPGCGMGPMIADDAKNKLLFVPGVDEAEVHLVWEPPWNLGMISEEGRMKLGLV